MLVVTGLGGGGRALAFAVDGQIIEASFQTQDGVHFTEVKPDSAVLEGLMDGRQVQVVAGQITAVFPLAGSDTAIRRAMKECSLQP
ncbi:hypothetical protein [Paracoccus sp. (in: a-proteobacteria)]|uniref:hypothetical protein n=1 Tax=Paracoccus sp. TaxID=267 RepID=UPI00396CC864